TYKQLYDSIKSSRVRSKEQCDDLINKVNLKSAKVSDLNARLQEKVLVDVAPLVPKLRKNRTAHTDYIRHTQEEAATLREIVESKRILLMILQQTCSCLTNLGTKLVAVTPKLKNTKNNRIQRTQKKAKKNKIEDHLRTVKSSLNKESVVDSKATSSVINSVTNVNSDLKCASCNGCLLFDNHNACVVAYINSVNASKESKSVNTPVKRKVWKTIGKVFKSVGHIWKPTGRIFTLVGNVCPLTRISTPTIVPLWEPIPIVNSTDKPVVTLVVQIVLWYLDSGCSKHMTGDRSQLVNFVQKFLGTVKFGNDHVAKIMGYGDYQIGNVTISRASKTKSWLWHRRLSHLNFGAINHLARQGLVRGLPMLKFEKDHLVVNQAPEAIAPIVEVIPPVNADSTGSPSSTTVEQDAPSTKPKTYKEALTQSCWIEAMQEELNEFECLEVWELVPRPDKVMVITLKTMETTIEQQVALDEALVPSIQRLRIGRVPEIYMQEFWATATIKTLTDVNVNKLYQPWRSFVAVINKCLTGKSTGFDSLRLSQAKILWGLYYRRNKPSIPRRNRVNWHYVGDDILFSTIKVVSRHQNTQKYGAILPIELTTEDIRNTKVYKEYYACATREAAPKPKASAKKKKGGSASSTTPPTPIATPTPTTTVVAAPRLSAVAKGKLPARATSPTDPLDVERTEAEQLKIVLRRSRQETHISQQRGSGTDEGTGSKPGVPDVPSDDSEEELSWNSSDDEDVDEQTKGRDASEGKKTDESDDDNDDQEEAEKGNDDDDDEEEISKIGEQEATESDKGDDEATENDRESEDEETREQEEESFDPIPRTPKESKDDDHNEEDQDLRIGEEERMHEEEEADELYCDVDINQGRGLQVSQETKDSHVILTPTQSDAQQESLSTSSFMTNLLNPIIDAGMELIFTTGSTTVTPIPSPQSTMTPSIIST
nr:integrase, catalytic region, zinc finger, CCHC-type, peptidase aspartic, catalytic [Tanacetum cinerariifolium]